MKIEYVTGNLFDTSIIHLVHGCNAQGAYQSGIAGIMRKLHPDAYEAYAEAYKTTGLSLGDVIWASSNGKIIGNLISQEYYGRDPNVVYANYGAIRTGMKEVNRYISQSSENRVAFPLIGAGLGRASWTTISNIIEEESTDFQPIVYTLDGFIPL